MRILDLKGNTIIELDSLTGANLTGAHLTRADLYEADLTRADLTRADLYEANLTRADLTGANLTEADLYGADLTGADLTGANLTEANLTGADLTRANLYGADLTRADLTEADLTGANLTGADLTRANLYGADLTGADLTRANLTDSKGLIKIIGVLHGNCYWKRFGEDLKNNGYQYKIGINKLLQGECFASDERVLCSYPGLHFASRSWCAVNYPKRKLEALIRIPEGAQINEPWATDGKASADMIEILQVFDVDTGENVTHRFEKSEDIL